MWHTRDTFRSKGRHGLKMREWKKLFHANENESWGSNIKCQTKYMFKSVTRDKGKQHNV